MPALYESATCELLITNSCNLKCDYCIAKNLPNIDMSYQVGRKAIDNFIKLALGVKRIDLVFTGGEPFTKYSLLKKLASYCINKAQIFNFTLNITIKTNGTILNQDMLNYIKSNSLNIVISIDGMADSHNRHRINKGGFGTHGTILKNILKIIDHGIEFSVNYSVHPNEVSYIYHSIRWLYEIGVSNINIAPVYGTVKWNVSDINSFRDNLFKIAKYISIISLKGECINIKPIEKDSIHNSNQLANLWGCEAAKTTLAYLPNGDIAGCSALAMLAHKVPKLIIGNVFDGIDQYRLNQLLEITNAPIQKRKNCKICETKLNCLGGCIAFNYACNKNALKPPPIYCSIISAVPDAWKIAWG
jgi:uncharacterized protein